MLDCAFTEKCEYRKKEKCMLSSLQEYNEKCPLEKEGEKKYEEDD